MTKRRDTMANETYTVYEVIYHNDSTPYIERFRKESEAVSFAYRREYYGKPASVSRVDSVPARLAQRWGVACWRCGGKPHEHARLKPRRPVCAECILELLTAALFDDEGEGALFDDEGEGGAERAEGTDE